MIVKLVGGPMNGRTVEVDDDAEVYRVARFWRYTWTNSKEKIGEQEVPLFALASPSRPVQRAVAWFIGKFGSHPAMQPKVQPHVKRPERGRNEPCKCGSGKKNKRCHDVV